MTGLRAVALALLLALGLVGGVALGATQPGPTVTVQSVDNGSNYLGPNASAVDRSSQATTTLDVAATVSANAGQVRSTFTRVSLQREYENAATPEARRAVVRNGTDRLTTRVTALERRERSAIERYAAGDVEDADLYRTVASVDAEAGERAETAAWLAERALELGLEAEARRLGTLQIRLLALQGPVREQIASGLAGAEPVRVHTDVAGEGIALATTTRTTADGEGRFVYVREAYSPAIRNRRSTDRYEGDFNAVFNRVGTLYPWVNANLGGVDGSANFGRNGAKVYRLTLQHDQGRLTPYLDGGSDRIVKEEQRLETDRLTTDGRNVSSEGGDLTARIETTYPSGPLGVTVVEPGENGTVDATVLVDGDRVGTTRGGTLWTVAPRGPANVTVLADDATIRTTVRAE